MILRLMSFFLRSGLMALSLIGMGCSESADTPEVEAIVSAASTDTDRVEQQSLAQFFQDHFDRELQRNPLSASYVGRETDNGRWNSVSEAFQDESRTLLQADLEAGKIGIKPIPSDQIPSFKKVMKSHSSAPA